MVKALRKTIQIFNRDLIIIGLLIVGYLVTRLVNLTNVPIFTDEAIYLRWAQIALHDASWRFISLTDGKQPLFIWFTMLVMKFLTDPLISGRLVSVVSGLSGLIGIFFLGRELFKNKYIGYLSSFLYLVSPFFLWYDKLAIMDSMLASFYIWSLYFEVLLVRRIRLDIALVLALVIGAGVLTKTSGFFAVYLMPFTLLLYDWKQKKTVFFKYMGLAVISVFLVYGYYSILRLSPWFYIITQKDGSFIYSFKDIISSPLKYFFGNLRGLSTWWYHYFTIAYIILLLVSFVLKKREFIKEKFFLLCFSLIPFLGLSVFGKVIYPRFILFMCAPLLVLSAYGLYNLICRTRKNIIYLAVILPLLLPIFISVQIVLSPINAMIPQSDRNQYLDDWPAGYGIKEVVSYLRFEKSKQKIFVATEGTFGLNPYALELAFWSDSDIEVKGYWPLPDKNIITNDAKNRPVYFILKESQQPPENWKVQLINQYPRGKGNTYLKFYRFLN